MKIKIIRYLTIAAIVTFLTSCFPGTVTQSYLGDLELGLSSSDVIEKMDTPIKEVDFNPPGIEGKGRAFSYRFVQGDQLVNYMLVFLDDKLVYWGYPHEFARHPDPKINKLGEIAVIELYGEE